MNDLAPTFQAGTHTEPPLRYPDEPFADYLARVQTAPVLLPERTSYDPRAETLHAPAVHPARTCELPGCGVVFEPKAANQRCCCRAHREARAKTGKQNRPARQFSGLSAAVPKLATAHKPTRRYEIVPAICPRHKQELRNGRPTRLACQACERLAERRAHGIQSVALVPIPCPICTTPFKAEMLSGGERRKTCSQPCATALRRQTWAARKEQAS